MADYEGISGTIFLEPEYRTTDDMVVALYFMLNRDMAGVVPVRSKGVATACRMTQGKFMDIVTYFRDVNKLWINAEFDGENRETLKHIWWQSGINYSLYGGKFSQNQMKSVQNKLKKWHYENEFGPEWLKYVVQVYERKYNLIIPIPKHWYTHVSVSVSESVSDVQPELKEGLSNFKNGEKKPTTPPENITDTYSIFQEAWLRYVENWTHETKAQYRPIYDEMNHWILGATILLDMEPFDVIRAPATINDMMQLITKYCNGYQKRHPRWPGK